MVTCTRNRGDTKYLRVLACLIDPLRLPVWKKSKKLLDDNFAQATGRALCPQIADAEALLEAERRLTGASAAVALVDRSELVP